ncbi:MULTISPECIES: response regulator transcription factor [Paenibacillus]|uniref:response regulator transcription factor n=1 Tax=Paenibacillus TaxID=44249 RepID=UPI0022B93C6C|nr:response regulator [Paenibacillus caseinilyticus]MCZ8518217.1 response regulator [Paenibacillus caseinilyticus]
MKLLIADDQMSLHQFLHKMIDWGALGITEVQSAFDGEQAAGLAASAEPDLLLMDIRMPGVNGIEALRRIQSQVHKPKAVILSAYDQFDYAREALKLSVSQYLLKPVDTQLLEAALRELIAEVRSERGALLERELVQLSCAARLPEWRLDGVARAFRTLEIACFAIVTVIGEAEYESASPSGYPSLPERVTVVPLPSGHSDGERHYFVGLPAEMDGDEQCAGLRASLGEGRGASAAGISRTARDVRELAQLLAESREAALRAREGSKACGDGAAPRTADKLQDIRLHIERHLDGDLCLQTVADLYGIDKFQLSRTFKQEFGENYWSYVTRLRLGKAAQLLGETDWKNGRIAEATGYADESHFSKAFKKHFGVAPKGYRASGQPAP